MRNVKRKLAIREILKLLFGVFTQLFFQEYPIIFQIKGTTMHKN